MKSRSDILLLVSLISLACWQLPAPAHAQPARNHAAGVASVTPAVPPLILLDPTEIRSKPTMASGCWVWLFPQRDYKGKDDIAIAGPVEIRSLHTPEGLDWHHKTESLIVGPKATLTVFENAEFRDRTAVFKPGTRVTHIRGEKNLGQSIDSLKLACGS